MSKIRSLGAGALFLAGCAVGGAASQFVVPRASAQATERWDYFCFDERSAADVTAKAKQVGEQGWEMAAAAAYMTSTQDTWCFKRRRQ